MRKMSIKLLLQILLISIIESGGRLGFWKNLPITVNEL